jgi:glycosyltransferase involved in cell wall biosynthesis
MMSQASSNLPWPRISVVVPTLNEARNLPHVFSRLPVDVYEVIVVDGHSVDDTIAVARQLRPDVRVVQQTRRGKGNALACGFEVATGDVIAMIDADGSADPGEIPKFVQALLSGADFAKGTRFAAGGGSSDITQLRRLGNRLLGTVINLCCGTHYSDLCYGFNVFWQKYVPVLDLDVTSPPSRKGDGRLWGDGFEIETLIHMRVADEGLQVAEVPSFEHPRIHGVSNLDAFSDGLRVLMTILVERRRARRRYRSRRRPSGARTAAVQARSLIDIEAAFIRMLYVLHSIEHGRPCMHRTRSRLSGHGPHRRPQCPPAGPATQESPSLLARITVYPPPSASARRHPVGHTCEAPGEGFARARNAGHQRRR